MEACPYCREDHKGNRLPFSFDGFGINGCDVYRSRLATFTPAASEDQRRVLGPLFAAAPDLLAALKDACASHEVQAATARSYARANQNAKANTGLAEELERNVGLYRAAIAKAEGRQP